MPYYNYHSTAKKLISEGKLTGFYYIEKYNHISPALVLIFESFVHPKMPIRQYRWHEYINLLPKDKEICPKI